MVDCGSYVPPKLKDVLGSCITTKIVPPRCSSEHLYRPCLIDRLNNGKDKVLTTVRAPAGFGKTTLLVRWRSELLNNGAIVGWYQIDDTDNEEAQFVSYILSSLSSAGCSLGDGAFSVYSQDSEDGNSEFIRGLVNDVAAFGQEVYLVIDDFWRLNNKRVITLICNMITFAPPNMHLVIASRSEPPFPLMDMRMHGDINEIEVNDLMFSYDDICSLMSDNLPISLTFDQVRVLYDLTEGWVAALQLIILSVKRHSNPSMQIDSIIALDGVTDIVEYLAHDWFVQVPDDMRLFLLKTCMFSRFNSEMASAVTGLSSTVEILQNLEAENLFVIPMEGEGRWYRYHHLFEAYLQRQLKEVISDNRARQELSDKNQSLQLDNMEEDLGLLTETSLEEIHTKASIWLAEHGYFIESANHAMAARDTGSALNVIEQCAMDLISEGDLNTLLSWTNRLPKEEIDRRPRLRFAHIWALLMSNKLNQAREELEILQVDEEASKQISELEFDSIRAGLAVYSFDSEAALVLKRHYPFAGDNWTVGASCNILGFGYLYSSQTDAADNILRWAQQRDPTWSSFYPGVYRYGFLAMNHFRQGELVQAETLFLEALTRSEQRGGRRSAPALVIAGMLSWVYYESNRLTEMEQLLADRINVISRSTYPGSIIPAYALTCRAKFLAGDCAGALETLIALEVYGEESGVAGIWVYANCERARFLLLDGHTEQAEALYEEILPKAERYLESYKGTDAQFGFAVRILGLRIKLGVHLRNDAVQEAETLYQQSLQHNPLTLQIEAQLMCCLALDLAGRSDEADMRMVEALQIGESCGLIRTFADADSSIVGIINRVFDHADKLSLICNKAYSESLMSAIGPQKRAAPTSSRLLVENSVIEEDLSRREIEILKLLDLGMPNKLVASSLNVSVNTIKWHLKNLYGKLGVSNRFGALTKARDKHLIP